MLPNANVEAPQFEDELSQQEQFKLDKKLFAQQMKQQLYGRPQTSVPQEENKGATPN